jgi:hypothetical protein
MGVAGFRTAAERTSADGGPAACSFVHLHATPRKPMRQLLKNTFTLALALVFTAGMAFGQSNETVVEQINDGNDATVNQVGQLNAADVNQGVDQEVNELANNLFGSDITGQVGPGTANDNEVTVTQEGTRNLVAASQGYAGNFNGTRAGIAEGNEATITQLGNRNVALPAQGLRGGEAYDNAYTILQDGNRNDATVAQGNNTGIAINNDATIEQFGSDNVGTILQGQPSQVTFGGFRATNSLAEIFQDGTNNTATVNQSN